MPDKSLTSPEEIIKQMVSTQYFAVLSSCEKAQPYNNLVAFAATDDFKSLIFITGRNTRKYRNIADNHRVSILIDNRTNNTNDVNHALAITAIGSAHEENKKRSFKAIFLSKHPQLSQFADAPDSALILVIVSEYIVAGFDKTQRVVVTS